MPAKRSLSLALALLLVAAIPARAAAFPAITVLDTIRPGVDGSYALWNKGRLGDYLYFGADDGVNGYELWRTNGTAAGTTLAQEINTGSGGLDSSSPDLFTALGGYLYFRANDNGVGKLWRISGQGEIESTVLPGTNSFIGCQCDRAITVLNGRLFMVLYSDETGSEFAYLNEPTFVLPGTNREGSAWSTALVLLAAATAVAGIGLRIRGVRHVAS